MPDDLLWRFNEWYTRNIGIDAQHNIFNRKFLMENDMRFELFGGNRLLALKWIMKAKVFVKTPESFYIYRVLPDSLTHLKMPPERIAQFIIAQIKLSRYLDDYFAEDDFFKNNPYFQYLARSKMFLIYDDHRMKRNLVYKDGITPELHRAVEEAFRKHFGNDAAFPTFLFHWIHTSMFGKRVDMIVPSRQSD